MILGNASKRDWQSLTIHGTPLETVSVYNLGVFISADLRWKTHIKYIISEAVSRLIFLNSCKELAYHHHTYYTFIVVRPIFEYASLLWHLYFDKVSN